ncbi:nucleoside hydrolase [Nocardioides sp. CGMCC 1.13656]|uniref:nucleoside hydrolase n=1 Tax=Nocardioides TaxID=1839 RepID=UPI0012F9FA21|nr:nucleoside hydrolase [Nocardioides sp. CGMCC 1.13656]MBA2955935.1 nucleoside hydrolase [Nocardioides sp. CGMCC 1.13656]
MKRLFAAAVAALALTGCSAPYDDDGEYGAAGSLAGAAAPEEDATPVVVDTDLAGDDLVALAYLLRRPDVRVVAVTVAGTGLVGCDPGVDLVADLVHALGEGFVPVACGREEPAREWPAAWVETAEAAPGLPRLDTTFRPASEPAPLLLAELAMSYPELDVVALGPLTNLADLAERWPDDYARLGGIHVMGGAVDVPAIDGVAEWNAAADPAAFAAVLAGRVPVTVVPDDPIPSGTPEELVVGVVGAIATAAGDVPKRWDLATAAAFVEPGLAETRRGTWTVDDTGRLTRTGPGRTTVVTALDEAGLNASYASDFSG